MILSEIKKKHDQSDGKCGISMVSLIEITEKPYDEIKKEIHRLLNLEKLRARPGINGKLFFYNINKQL